MYVFAGCSDAVTSIARLTAAWKLPHITYAGTFEQLADKAEYSTLTRTAFNLNAFAKFYMEVLKVNVYIYTTLKLTVC